MQRSAPKTRDAAEARLLTSALSSSQLMIVEPRYLNRRYSGWVSSHRWPAARASTFSGRPTIARCPDVRERAGDGNLQYHGADLVLKRV